MVMKLNRIRTLDDWVADRHTDSYDELLSTAQEVNTKLQAYLAAPHKQDGPLTVGTTCKPAILESLSLGIADRDKQVATYQQAIECKDQLIQEYINRVAEMELDKQRLESYY